jgi:hypothetical protein
MVQCVISLSIDYMLDQGEGYIYPQLLNLFYDKLIQRNQILSEERTIQER